MGKWKNSDFFKRITAFLFPPFHHLYLRQHGFFDSFDDSRHMRPEDIHPFLPYSLFDILEGKNLSGLNIFIASHPSTAAWLSRRENTITLGRKLHRRWKNDRVKTVFDYRECRGEFFDMVIWDSHYLPDDWQNFLDVSLSPRGVVIFVFSNFYAAMELGLGSLGDMLVERGMRSLTFQNPGPRTEIMTAELYYPRDNVLGI